LAGWGGRKGKGKVFFFEKKKQKTFVYREEFLRPFFKKDCLLPLE
jgi:hypothetical protein